MINQQCKTATYGRLLTLSFHLCHFFSHYEKQKVEKVAKKKKKKYHIIFHVTTANILDPVFLYFSLVSLSFKWIVCSDDTKWTTCSLWLKSNRFTPFKLGKKKYSPCPLYWSALVIFYICLLTLILKETRQDQIPNQSVQNGEVWFYVSRRSRKWS